VKEPVTSEQRVPDADDETRTQPVMQGKALRTAKRAGKANFYRRDRLSFLLLMGPPFLVIFVLTVVPFFYSVYLSTWKMNFAMPQYTRFVGLGNFIYMVTEDPYFWTIIRNTGVQVFGTVSLQVVVGVLLALLFSRPVRGMNVARSLLMLPMMATPVVIGVIWRFMVNPEFGIINYLLSLLNIPGPDWLGRPGLAMGTIIAADVWLSTPFVTVILIAGISSLPVEPFEAATVDGATSWQTFVHITMPLLSPVIWVAVMFRLIDALKRFDSIVIMTAGGPGNATETLNLFAYSNAFTMMDAGYGSALAVLLFLLIGFVSIFTIRRVQRGGSA
jgi:multiple sugar transport system permease protein